MIQPLVLLSKQEAGSFSLSANILIKRYLRKENKWARATYRSQSIVRSVLSLTDNDTDMTAAQAQTYKFEFIRGNSSNTFVISFSARLCALLNTF